MSKQALTSFPKEKINILFLENISEKAVQQFKQNGYANVKKIAGALSEEDLIKEIKDVHLIGIRSKTQITPKVLAGYTTIQSLHADECEKASQIMDWWSYAEINTLLGDIPLSITPFEILLLRG